MSKRDRLKIRDEMLRNRLDARLPMCKMTGGHGSTWWTSHFLPLTYQVRSSNSKKAKRQKKVEQARVRRMLKPTWHEAVERQKRENVELPLRQILAARKKEGKWASR
jgi:predicted solute-binding protein